MKRLSTGRRRAKKERPHLTLAMFERLVAASPKPWATWWRFCFFTGCRISEARGARWADILWTSRQVSIANQLDRYGRLREPKYGSVGVVDAADELLEALVQHRGNHEAAIGRPVGPDDFVFVDPETGRVPVYTTALSHLRDCLEAAKLSSAMATHVFRHGAAYVAKAANAPPLAIQQQMRHSSLATTNAYLHDVPHAGRAVVDAVELLRKKTRSATQSG